MGVYDLAMVSILTNTSLSLIELIVVLNMKNKSRLNPNKQSRASLKLLEDKGILHRQKVGLRHIIQTDGTVQHVGYDLGSNWYSSNLPNYYPGVSQTYGTVVQYNNARAELTATLGRKGWEGHILDVGTHFPPNPLATQLWTDQLQSASLPYSDSVIYGDAVLVTDNRMHWTLRPRNASVEDLEIFDEMLSTPRDLIVRGDYAQIFFHTEPNQNDIVALMMRWL
jgi:hypothetical protein